MTIDLRLLAVFAHPDDESLGIGGALAKYTREGVETHLLTATRGQRGYRGLPDPDPGPEGFGAYREGELREAGRILGLSSVTLLDYMDGDLDQADPAEAAGLIAAHIRRVRPQVVVTFGPDGAYGHPDHIAISQYTTAALVLAADPKAPAPAAEAPHRVAKFYHMVDSKQLIATYNQHFPELCIEVDGTVRRWAGWDDWAITTMVDADADWETACEAIACHRSQLVGFDGFQERLREHHTLLVGQQNFYRAYSLVNGGRRRESDLFEGLRG